MACMFMAYDISFLFQAGLMQDNPAINFLEDYAKTVLQKNIETVYACGGW